ncbi:hypothetical protein HG530_011676 [Fusarium avenaceum]|nr:hypothetical protein HG530_011676 [Fusarium avenaceum]
MENNGRCMYCNKPWVGRHPGDVNHVLNHLYRGQLNLQPAFDKHDADPEDIDLNNPDVPAYLSLAEDHWDYILQPLFNALRPLRGLPYFLIMPIHSCFSIPTALSSKDLQQSFLIPHSMGMFAVIA